LGRVTTPFDGWWGWSTWRRRGRRGRREQPGRRRRRVLFADGVE